jgi:hypothetical protein
LARFRNCCCTSWETLSSNCTWVGNIFHLSADRKRGREDLGEILICKPSRDAIIGLLTLNSQVKCTAISGQAGFEHALRCYQRIIFQVQAITFAGWKTDPEQLGWFRPSGFCWILERPSTHDDLIRCSVIASRVLLWFGYQNFTGSLFVMAHLDHVTMKSRPYTGIFCLPLNGGTHFGAS